jgi:hypothetical protein
LDIANTRCAPIWIAIGFENANTSDSAEFTYFEALRNELLFASVQAVCSCDDGSHCTGGQLGGFKRSSQHLDEGGCDGQTKAEFRLAHWRRKFYDVHESTNSPIAKESLDRIGKLYDVERTISGKTKEQRQAVRDTKSRPLTESFKTWLEARLKELPEKFDLTSAINYGLSRWNAFTLFLDDPAAAIDNNAAERAIRPLVIGRRNWTFAGSDRGAENAATIMSLP